VRHAAAHALGRFGTAAAPVVPALAAALGTNGEWVGEEVARTLGGIGPAAHDAVPALREARKGPALLEQAATEALKKILVKKPGEP
jgi:hypothetical protein